MTLFFTLSTVTFPSGVLVLQHIDCFFSLYFKSANAVATGTDVLEVEPQADVVMCVIGNVHPGQDVVVTCNYAFEMNADINMCDDQSTKEIKAEFWMPDIIGSGQGWYQSILVVKQTSYCT